MSCVQLSEGGFQVVYPLGLACGPGSPELSKSNLDMASKLFTFYIFKRYSIPINTTVQHGPGNPRPTLLLGNAKVASTVQQMVNESTAPPVIIGPDR